VEESSALAWESERARPAATSESEKRDEVFIVG
jgi:hypothetical protein